MKICLTIPGFNPHGGIRVILEWANRLNKNHDVCLYSKKGPDKCDWFNIDSTIKICKDKSVIDDCDCLVISSPHDIELQDYKNKPDRVFIFMQMLEHMFDTRNDKWQKLCNKFYISDHPLISISKWNIAHLNSLKRKGQIHYIGNGINLKDFPISYKKKDGKTILVEGWEPTNLAKDINHFAHKVSKRLKNEGYKIIAYSQLPLKTYPDIPDEYYCNPDNKTMNRLYEDATILLKASRYDARSTSPIEAMTKGTVTVRALIKGDDDLIHKQNCYRVGYNESELYEAAKLVLENKELREKLSKTCIEYVKENTWEKWMPRIEEILTS